jgi:hypothetical protein
MEPHGRLRRRNTLSVVDAVVNLPRGVHQFRTGAPGDLNGAQDIATGGDHLSNERPLETPGDERSPAMLMPAAAKQQSPLTDVGEEREAGEGGGEERPPHIDAPQAAGHPGDVDVVTRIASPEPVPARRSSGHQRPT